MHGLCVSTRILFLENLFKITWIILYLHLDILKQLIDNYILVANIGKLSSSSSSSHRRFCQGGRGGFSPP